MKNVGRCSVLLIILFFFFSFSCEQVSSIKQSLPHLCNKTAKGAWTYSSNRHLTYACVCVCRPSFSFFVVRCSLDIAPGLAFLYFSFYIYLGGILVVVLVI